MSVTLLFIIAIFLCSYNAFQKPYLIDKYIMSPYQIVHHKQYYRLLTSGFFHADYTHLIFNLLSLYFFGDVLEAILAYHYGNLYPIYYVLFFLFASVIADLYAVYRYKDIYNYASLGASGAVSGVVFFSIMFNPTSKIYLMLIPIGIPAYVYGVLYLAYSYYQARNAQDHIAHDAHLLGSLSGILFAFFIDPYVLSKMMQTIF